MAGYQFISFEENNVIYAWNLSLFTVDIRLKAECWRVAIGFCPLRIVPDEGGLQRNRIEMEVKKEGEV